ncbi:MAG: hypothetical protein E6Q34_12095 [Burkholderiaceae bacterium]|nr:MAG: hypothetical protein E6Q34_12095 [Burkholderiaceae bacterium]
MMIEPEPVEDIQARLEIVRLHEVVRHLAFLVQVMFPYVAHQMEDNLREELGKQLKLIAEIPTEEK